MRNRPWRRTVIEPLESRCLLATTPLGESLFSPAEVLGAGHGFFAGRNGARESELEAPKFEILPGGDDGGLIPIPSEPPFAENPPSRDWPEQPEFIPDERSEETGPGNPHHEPDGGLADFGNGAESGEPSTMDEPSPREVRSVLAMLAALKYPVGGLTETVRNSDSDNPFELIRQQRKQNLDGGAVELAVQEVADELAAAPPQAAAAVQSWLEIAVPMDRSAGRYQAFEVLTTEEVSFVPQGSPGEEFVPIQIQFGDSREAQASDPSAGDASAVPLHGGGDEISGISPNPLPTAEEARGWSLTFGLVALGFVLQLLPKKHAELLKSQLKKLPLLVYSRLTGEREQKLFPEI